MREVWIITGMPGAGKSTIAPLLAERFERGVYIRGDRVAEMIVRGQVDPDEHPREEAERQIKLHHHNFGLLAQSFTEAGFVTVIDWVIRHKEDLDNLLRELSGCTVHVVALAPALSVIAKRKPHAYQRWAYLKPEFTRELKSVGLWVDSTELTIEETVDYILQNKFRSVV